MLNRRTISLVIPAYNEESHLAQCLGSALAQDVPFREIIVVDNASTDRTVAVAQQFPSVRIVREQKRGIVQARNAGFDAARGDIIARIDADTVLPADWSAHITGFYSDASTARTAWTGGGTFMDVPFTGLVSRTYHLMAFRANQLLIGYPTLWGSNMAFPVSAWRTVRRKTCRRHGIHEDLDLAMHLHATGMKIHYDSSMPVPASLRRARASRPELWDYLQWWPQTLKLHGYKTWRICWLIGVLPLYLATPFLNIGGALKRGTAQLLAALEA
jgi:glycosyltransferase involved in cell wall biosynthesis